MTRRLISIATLLSLLAFALPAVQMNTVVKHRSSGPLAFVNATSASNLTSASSITSPALTLTAGDFVFVECLFSAGTTVITASSTPSNTWNNSLTSSGAAIGGMQAGYAFGVGAGSTTFTCNYSPASTVQIIIVLQYHPGFLTVFDAQTNMSGSNSGTNVITSSFTTTAKGLIIVCGHDDNSTPTWSAGLIGGVTGTLRQSNLTLACEDTMPNAAQTATGALTLSSSANWIVDAKTFK